MKITKITAGIVSVAMVLTMGLIPEKLSSEKVVDTEITASAENTETSGTCGENLTWELSDDSVLTISGKGAMTDFGDGYSPFYCREDIKSVIIEDGVTSIGKEAFFYCSGLTSITIPDRYTY